MFNTLLILFVNTQIKIFLIKLKKYLNFCELTENQFQMNKDLLEIDILFMKKTKLTQTLPKPRAKKNLQ